MNSICRSARYIASGTFSSGPSLTFFAVSNASGEAGLGWRGIHLVDAVPREMQPPAQSHGNARDPQPFWKSSSYLLLHGEAWASNRRQTRVVELLRAFITSAQCSGLGRGKIINNSSSNRREVTARSSSLPHTLSFLRSSRPPFLFSLTLSFLRSSLPRQPDHNSGESESERAAASRGGGKGCLDQGGKWVKGARSQRACRA